MRQGSPPTGASPPQGITAQQDQSWAPNRSDLADPPDPSAYMRPDGTVDFHAFNVALKKYWRAMTPEQRLKVMPAIRTAHEAAYLATSPEGRQQAHNAALADFRKRPEYHAELEREIIRSGEGRRTPDGRLMGIMYRRTAGGTWQPVDDTGRRRGFLSVLRRPITRVRRPRARHRRERHVARSANSADPGGGDTDGPALGRRPTDSRRARRAAR